MNKLRFYCACGSLLIAIVLAVLRLIDGQLIAALSYLACGLAAGYVFLLGQLESIFEPGYQSIVQAIGIVGIFGVFMSHRALDFDLQRGYAGAMLDIALLTERCTPITPDLRNLQERGMMACATQNLRDTSDLTFELEKGASFGPGLTLIDGVATVTKEVEPNACAHIFKTAIGLCPYAFPSVEKQSRIALLRAAE